jgi:Zn-dependent peptidase ImmA (M78 family)
MLFGKLEFKMPEVEQKAVIELKNCGQLRIPIDIELIVELNSNIQEIRPLKGMAAKFDVAAALCPTKEKKITIFVDENEFDNCTVRSRFSVAHELGHVILHTKIYNSVKEFTAEEAVKIQKSFESSYKHLEQQANYFAGAVLMPYEIFTKTVYDLFKSNVRECNYDFVKLKQIISHKLAPIFDVSTYAAGFRLDDTGLEGYIRRAVKNKFDDLDLQFME